jgi:hypothetical protein
MTFDLPCPLFSFYTFGLIILMKKKLDDPHKNAELVEGKDGDGQLGLEI